MCELRKPDQIEKTIRIAKKIRIEKTISKKSDQKTKKVKIPDENKKPLARNENLVQTKN